MAKESSSSRRARVKLQLRDSKGRWIEMGGSVKWYSSKLKKDVSGIVTGSKGNNVYVKLNSAGVKSKTVSVPAHTVENVQNKATLGQDPAVSGLLKGTTDLLTQAHQNSAKPVATSPFVGTPQDYKTAVTSDGLLYAGRKDDQELYTPAKDLEVGDTLMSPVGTDPSKPYSIGASWNRRGVEAFDPWGTGIGKVVEVKEDSHATIQLPEGDTSPDGSETVTVGIENDVIMATPGLTEAFEKASAETPNESVVEDADLEDSETDVPENVPVPDEESETPTASEGPEESVEAELPADLPTDVDEIAAGLSQIYENLKNADGVVSDESLAAIADENRLKVTSATGEQFMVSPSRDFDGNWSFDLTDSLGSDKGSWSTDTESAASEIHSAVNTPTEGQVSENTEDNFDKSFGGLFLENGFSKAEQFQHTSSTQAYEKFGSPSKKAFLEQMESIRDSRIAAQKKAIEAANAGEGFEPGSEFSPVNVPTPVDSFITATKISVGDRLLLNSVGGIAVSFDKSLSTGNPLALNGKTGVVTDMQPILGKNKTSMGKPVGMLVEVEFDDGTFIKKEIYENSGGSNSKRGVFLDTPAFRKGMNEFLTGNTKTDANTETKATITPEVAPEPVATPDADVADAPVSNEFTEADKARMSELEAQIANIYANKAEGDVEALETELDSLYVKEENAGDNPTPSEEGSTPVEVTPESVAEPEVASKVESAPTEPKTDGKSLVGADGSQVYEGSKVTHPTNGPGTVQKIIAGKTAKILFDSGIVKIAQANKISSQSDEPAAPIDVSSMSPGESAINPANGKLFIVGADGSAISTGDKVSATHKGETKSGTVKGIYKGTSSVAIIFDGETKPSTKKATATKSLETPEKAPESDANTPETTPEAPESVEEAPAAPEATPVAEEVEEAPTNEPEVEATTDPEELEATPEEEEPVSAESDEAPIDQNEAEIVAEEDTAEVTPRRREFVSDEVREEVLDNLAPLDTSNWTNVTQDWKSEGNSTGSNPGGVFEDENGKRWYVKQSKSDAHARAETLAAQIYVMSGIDTPALRLVDFNGKLGTASPMLEGAKSDLGSKFSDKEYMGKIQEGFAVDAWLANWDVLGLENDNIVSDANGNPVRIDTGGALMFRAQGGLKNNIQAGAWGNDVKDWEGLQTKGEAQKAFGNLTDEQKKDSAARVESVTPDQIDEMVDGLGYTGPEAEELKNTLKARREDIIVKASELSATEDSFAPSNEPSTDPASNVLTGYTIKQNENGVYYPEENLPPAVVNGIRNGTITLPNLPFITRNTKSGDVHYYDSNGVRHWGQYGAEGALVRRKNAAGEFEYLMVQRNSSLSTGGGKWSVPGGAHKSLQDSENAGTTASTELSEELGMDAGNVPVANFTDSSTPDWAYNYAIYDAPDMDDEDLTIDDQEISDHKWMTPAEIKELSAEGKLYESMSAVLDDIFNESDNTPEAEKTASAKASVDSSITIGSDNGGTEFKKVGGNKWNMFVNGIDTGIKANNEQIQGVSDNNGLSIVDVNSPEMSPSIEEEVAEAPAEEGSTPDVWSLGDVLDSPQAMELENLPVGAKIEVDNYKHYIPYTKTPAESMPWINDFGDYASSWDLADGDSYKIIELNGENLDAPEAVESEPIQFELDPEEYGMISDLTDELIPSTKIVSVGDVLEDLPIEEIDALPVGITISKMFGGAKKSYTKVLDALAGGDSVWENENGIKILANLFAQNSDFTVDSIGGDAFKRYS